MARRKRAFLDDEDMDSSDGSEAMDEDMDDAILDPDERAERELYADPYQRKRRRKNGKDAAAYGVFYEDEDERQPYAGTGARRKKAPAFVSSEKIEDKVEDSEDEDAEGEDYVEEDEDAKMQESDQVEVDQEEADSDASEEDEPPQPASPRIRPQEEDYDDTPRPRIGGGGIGFSKSSRIETLETTTQLPPTEADEPPARGGLGMSGRGGIGSGRGGIGSSASTNLGSSDLPTAFGTQNQATRTQRSFVRNETSRPITPSLSTEEARHFSTLQGTYGAKLLAKMGWTSGTGLGSTGQGIVTPIETKLRPEKRGIAYGGFKERTKQAKAEDRRRGKVVSSDSDDDPKSRKAKAKSKAKTADGKPAADRAEQWKKPKKTKRVVHYRTYEEIMQEPGQESTPDLGVIIDATGKTPREITSLSQASASPWGATNDPTRLPELRHNLRLVVDMAKSDLDGLAREAKSVRDHKKFILEEDARLRKIVGDEAELIARLQKVHLVVDEIKVAAKEAAGLYEATLDGFSKHFETLVREYSNECDKYGLDEIMVAAIAPVFRRMLGSWNPLLEPMFLTQQLRQWRTAFKMSQVIRDEPDSFEHSWNGDTSKQQKSNLAMSPYESLLWNVWLPKVRSCVNNEWSPTEPQPLIQMLESWTPLLPQFIRDNVLDQLILPKVANTVADWNPRSRTSSLHEIVFPWLPHVGLRIEQLVGDAKRKVKSLFRSWKVEDGLPKDLMVWKDVFDSAEWENLLIKYVVPKLGAILREDFKINPRDQKMEPLLLALQWHEHLRPSIFAQLLELEFFSKWLEILYVWLIQPKVNFDEVAKWFEFWQKTFPEKIYALPGVTHGFTAGLQLVNKAMDLGSDAPRLLEKPQFKPLSSTAQPAKPSKRPQKAQHASEVTFKSIVEDHCATHNLLFLPTGKSHPKSRMPLFKVSQNVDGKGGLSVYVLDDAVWAPDPNDPTGDDYRAISLDDMVLRATKAKK
ncbi:hypothetical protein FRC03_002008 [Tulasnella sp. 419]|nr:hypothetical protein FRC03_002008 [Tulasnella sp. 419]